MKKVKKITAFSIAAVLTVILALNTFICGVSALSIFANIKEVKPDKEVIKVGETLQLNVVWDTGTKMQAVGYSDNINVLEFESMNDTKTVCTFVGAGEGTAKIGVRNNIYSSELVEIEVVSGDTETYCEYSYEINDSGIVFKKNEKSFGMFSFIVSTNYDYDVSWNDSSDKKEFTFTPKDNGEYVITVSELRESMPSCGTEESHGHFHYFYPVMTNYIVNVSEGNIELTELGKYNLYSDEQIKNIQEKMADEEQIACFDVYAEGSDIINNQFYFSFVNGNIPSWGNEEQYKSYITSIYGEYSTSSYFCVNTPYFDGETDDPIVKVSDDSFALVMDKIYTSSDETADDIMDFYAVKALNNGKLTVNAHQLNQFYYLEIKDGIFRRADEPCESIVKGDANNDGEFNIADLVTIQNYLTKKSMFLSGYQFEYADMNDDGKVNVFDAVIMKRKLITEQVDTAEPALMIIKHEVWAIGSKQRDTAIVVDTNGVGYSKVYDKPGVYPENWLGEYKNVISGGEKGQYVQEEDVIKVIEKFAKNAVKYENCKMTDEAGLITDIGDDTLYVIYNDENGNRKALELGYIGGACGWMDNKEVQDFIEMLVENGYFGNKIIYDDWQNYLLNRIDKSLMS